MRAPHLTGHRPVSARRVVQGQVRLVVVMDLRDRAAMLAATVAGVVALLLAGIGWAVIV